MEKEQIISIIYEWQNSILQIGGVARKYENELLSVIGSKPIKIVTGFRRSGKSFLLQRLLKSLVNDKKVKLENVLYLNFEDFRLTTINSSEKLAHIYSTFTELIASGGDVIVALDEIQNVNNWDKFVRTLYEKKSTSKNNIEIILTGSNSELLSSEIGTNLSGRFIEFFILPFSFSEYLYYLNIEEINSEQKYYRNNEKIKKLFYAYIKYGGLPEHFSITNEKAKYSYLEGVLNKVILDDVIKRFNVKNAELVEKVLQYQMSCIGNIVSYSRIKNYISELGYDIKQDTIVNYVRYFLKSFALYEVGKFDWKAKRVFSGSKKYYSIDTGIANLYKGLTNNLSKLLENIVFLHLRRNNEGKNIHYFGNTKEIDFIVESKKGVFTKYQVCQKLINDNEQRELSAFLDLDKYLIKGKNFILTLDDEEKEINFKGIKIQKKNIVKFILGV